MADSPHSTLRIRRPEVASGAEKRKTKIEELENANGIAQGRAYRPIDFGVERGTPSCSLSCTTNTDWQLGVQSFSQHPANIFFHEHLILLVSPNPYVRCLVAVQDLANLLGQEFQGKMSTTLRNNVE